MNRAGALAVALLAFVAAAGPAPGAGPGFEPIPLTTTPVDFFALGSKETRFGLLEFRGGLDVNSTDPRFGSLSGLDIAPDGTTLYAVADTGYWFTARLVEENGRLTGLADAALGPILDRQGEPVATKHLADAEGLRLATIDGRLAAFVSFERVNNVRQYLAAPDLAASPSRPVRLPAMVSGLRPNKGLEAIAIAPADSAFAGAIVLVAERSLDAAGNNRAWIVGGPLQGAFSVVRSENFDVTDAAFAPDGSLFILERKLAFPTGFHMRIRRIAAAAIRPGAMVDGTTLIEADLRDQIDNMEGMALRAGPDGETLIDIVSDDNQSAFQRTLLLQFALPANAH